MLAIYVISEGDDAVTGDTEEKPPEQAVKRAHWLQAELERHNELYYVEARPEITDQEFDQLLHELESLENQYPSLRTSESPTQRSGRKADRRVSNGRASHSHAVDGQHL